jgi:hypothetical protein
VIRKGKIMISGTVYLEVGKTEKDLNNTEVTFYYDTKNEEKRKKARFAVENEWNTDDLDKKRAFTATFSFTAKKPATRKRVKKKK